jgi:hypothetical protein
VRLLHRAITSDTRQRRESVNKYKIPSPGPPPVAGLLLRDDPVRHRALQGHAQKEKSGSDGGGGGSDGGGSGSSKSSSSGRRGSTWESGVELSEKELGTLMEGATMNIDLGW